MYVLTAVKPSKHEEKNIHRTPQHKTDLYPSPRFDLTDEENQHLLLSLAAALFLKTVLREDNASKRNNSTYTHLGSRRMKYTHVHAVACTSRRIPPTPVHKSGSGLFVPKIVLTAVKTKMRKKNHIPF